MDRKFGWSLPPGVTTLPGEEEYPCEVCGQSLDKCDCPECPVCHEVGNPACYSGHGLQMSLEQTISKTGADIADMEEQLVDLKMYYEWLVDRLERENET